MENKFWLWGMIQFQCMNLGASDDLWILHNGRYHVTEIIIDIHVAVYILTSWSCTGMYVLTCLASQ